MRVDGVEIPGWGWLQAPTTSASEKDFRLEKKLFVIPIVLVTG
jgi:hypothetical protein